MAATAIILTIFYEGGARAVARAVARAEARARIEGMVEERACGDGGRDGGVVVVRAVATAEEMAAARVAVMAMARAGPSAPTRNHDHASWA